MYCTYFGYKNLVLYLLTHGADPYQQSAQGWNVFHLCCNYGRFEIAQVFYHYERHCERL